MRESVRFTIDIDANNHKRLKVYAAATGKSMREIINELIIEKLNQMPGQKRNIKKSIAQVFDEYDEAFRRLAKM